MKKKESIEITKEKKLMLISEIKTFFIENRDEEIGDLQAELLVNMLIEKAGAEIYNQALNDAMYWLKNRMSDVEIDFYTLEKKPGKINKTMEEI